MPDQDTEASRAARHETEAERADRNFNELLQELRVAQTGVQFLFAFLLTIPFTERFTMLPLEGRTVYLVTMITASLAMACLVAPVSYHRLLFRQGLKRQIVTAGSRLAQAGLAFLCVTVVGALYLVVDVVVNTRTAIAVATAMAVVFALLWYILPMRHREAGGADAD